LQSVAFSDKNQDFSNSVLIASLSLRTKSCSQKQICISSPYMLDCWPPLNKAGRNGVKN